ncbi:sensor histidine kinase [Streptomyces varsoviensis]|uniref:sensor histidine kinase n=1 Tax=Streptomyces varsoviensis TaxID=67373 RepID=UPI003F4CEB89
MGRRGHGPRRGRLKGRLRRRRAHGRTVRTRVAIVFGGVFLVLGTALLVFVNVLSSAGTQERAGHIRSAAQARSGHPVEVYVPVRRIPLPAPTFTPGTSATAPTAPTEGPYAKVYWMREIAQVSDGVSQAASQQLVFWSVVALLVTALLAVGVGWWTAGRVLRPVHVMTAKARRISGRNLHERIGQGGPDDELKELADTIDALLGRLQEAFDSQRRFIANASHELRTPLATQRAAIQVGLEGGRPSAEELAETKETLLATNRRSERLIDGLLVLARSERGLESRERLNLADVVAEETAAVRGRAERSKVKVTVRATDAQVWGNRLLLGQLTGNLLRNAVIHNHEGGTVDVRVGPRLLTVRNTGPFIEPGEVEELFEPFRRGDGRDRLGSADGTGLGLSIVRSIARAHGGVAEATANPGGGLTVTVRLGETNAPRGRFRPAPPRP